MIAAGAVRRLRQADGLGRRGAPLKVRANAETPLDAAHRAQVRRRGHRPVPHRAHVLRRRPHRRRARDDPGRRRGGPPRGAGQDPADAARATSSSCSTIMAGLPVTIRLLDPPLHEFLPHTEEDMEAVAEATGVDVAKLDAPRAASCTRPTRCSAIAAAASASPIPRSTRCRCAPSSRRRRGAEGDRQDASMPEIMIPLVARPRRSSTCCKAMIDRVADGGDARAGRRSSTIWSAP